MEGFESFVGVNFWTALFTLLNFLALFFVLKHFLVGPVIKIIQDRQKEIDDMYDSMPWEKNSATSMQLIPPQEA